MPLINNDKSVERLTQTTRARFLLVALVVCLFASGMATFLNYYKYKSTLEKTVRTRVLVIGYGVENSIQSSLGLGLAFEELATLPALLARERTADPLMLSIEVFDASGRVRYSSDPAGVDRSAPPQWLEVATRSKSQEWWLSDSAESVAGLVLKNNFNLTVGYLAIRYQRAYVDGKSAEMRADLLLIGAGALLVSLLLAWLALRWEFGRFEADMRALEAHAAGSANAPAVPPAFEQAVSGLRESVASAEEALQQAESRSRQGA